MTSAEIITAAREIVKSQSWPEAKAKLCEHGQSIAAEFLRLHDGAEALRAERDQLRREVGRLTHWPGDDFKSCGELSCDDCNERALSLLNERDQLRREVESLNEMIRQYGFGQGEINGWASEHQELKAELAEAKSALATQQRCPWDRSLDEICPVHGGPCGQCPIPQRLEARP